MKKILLFFLLVPFLFKCSCQKDKVYPTYYIDQEFKDYCVFPVGSYWVYEDSASKAIDSISVFLSEISIMKKNNKQSYNSENFTLKTARTYTNDTTFAFGYHYSFQGDCYVLNEGVIFNYTRTDFAKFFSIKDTGYVLNSSECSILKHESNLDSIIINANKYYNIKVFTNIFFPNPPYAEENRIFHSRKVGVIRRELHNGQVWNLIRYHIN
jgi:hypothetical protein